MKKYAVLKQIGDFRPDVAEVFDTQEDANQYANLMNKVHPNWEYCVYTQA